MIIQRSFLESYDEVAKETWTCDRGRSRAYYHVTREVYPDGVRCHAYYGLELHPYPNPLGWGGTWGGGPCSEWGEPLNEWMRFERDLERARAHGLTIIEYNFKTDLFHEPEFRWLAREMAQRSNKLLKKNPHPYHHQASEPKARADQPVLF